jgi:hypothetical protein
MAKQNLWDFVLKKFPKNGKQIAKGVETIELT